MKKKSLKALGSCFFGLTLAASMVPVGASAAFADTNTTYWETPSSAVTIDTSKIMKTYGVRAGSAGGEFVGLSNTNFDFTSGKASQADQYTGYTAADMTGVKGAGLAIWATSVNENPNPFYANLMYNTVTGGTATAATTWMSNPEESAWGDSNGSASTKADGGAATIAGLEFNPEIIFGANKTTSWGNMDVTETNIYKQVQEEQKAGSTYDPTFTNNDSTNLWTQVYTINQLGTTADAVKGDKTVRYDDNSAIEGALSYEKSLRGNLLYIASQIDAGKVAKKTVAYLYAIDENGTGYFFIPEADGLINGNDTGKTATSVPETPDSNYAANNGTIDLDYMDTLPFITNTFKNGTAVEGGIVMRCEDIWKSNPAVSVDSTQTSALAGVDVIIYNSTVNTALDGTSGGKNSSGINNAAALSTDSVSTWAKSHGFTGAQIIAGDDYGTSTNQGYGTKDATADGMSPLLYCQRNYTTDKPARAVWAFSKVYSELYPNDDASYAYWVDKVYHVNTANVGSVVKYMTNQSDTVVYNDTVAAAMESNFQTGLVWWLTKGSTDANWSKYAYYNGSSRASYYNTTSSAAASEEATDFIGIFAPTSTWKAEAPMNQIFPDVTGDEWYVTEGYLGYAYANGILSGYSNGQFAGTDPVTRAQVATILYRLAGTPDVTVDSSFTDVAAGDWFAKAVTWAKNNGIITGDTDANGNSAGTFRPNDNVTRQDICVMVSRYAEKINGTTVSSDCSKLDALPDHGDVAPYARTAMGWCMDQSIISGSSIDGQNYAKATETAQRGQAAKIFTVFDQLA